MNENSRNEFEEDERDFGDRDAYDQWEAEPMDGFSGKEWE